MSREHWVRTNQLNSSAILPQKSKKSKNYFKESLLPKQLYASKTLYFKDFSPKRASKDTGRHIVRSGKKSRF